MRSTIATIVILLLVLVILTAAGLYVLQTPWFLNFAEAQLTDAIGQEVTIGLIDVGVGGVLHVRVENASVANPSWASTPFLASVDVLEAKINLMDLLGGDLVFEALHAKKPLVHLERSADGTANWEAGKVDSSTNDGPVSHDQEEEDSTTNLPLIESLLVKDGQLTYTDSERDTSIHLSLTSEGRAAPEAMNRLMADGGGTFVGQPVHIELEAGRPPELSTAQEKEFPLKVRLESVETTLLIEGRMDALLSPEEADLQIQFIGQNLARWNEAVNMELPSLPAYQLSVRALLSDHVWSFHPVHFTVGDSRIAGSVQVRTDDDPLHIESNLFSERLNVPQIQSYLPDKPETPLTVTVGNFLHFLSGLKWQGELQYRADVIETGEWPVTNAEMSLVLKEHSLTLRTLSGGMAGTRIHAEGELSTENKPAEGNMQVHFETGRTSEMSKIAGAQSAETMTGLPGKLEGELAVNFALNHHPVQENNASTTQQNAEAYRAELKSIAVENFHLLYTETASNSHITARLNEEEQSEDTMIIGAEGRYHNQPVEFSLRLPQFESSDGAGIKFDSPQRFALDLTVADATAAIHVHVLPDWPPTNLDLFFTIDSPTPATTGALLGINPSIIGKASLRGSIAKRDNTWTIDTFHSRFGENAIHGQAVIHTADKVEFQAVLTSPKLDIAGLIPADEEDTESASSATSDEQASVSSESVTTEPLIPPWVTNLKGQIGLHVEQLVVPKGSLKDVSAKIAMDDGRLRLAPLSLELGGGTITTMANLDLHTPSLAGNLHTEIKKVDVDHALQSFGREPADLGQVSGRIALGLSAERQRTGHSFSTDAILERVRIEDVRLRYDDPAIQGKSNLRLTADSLSSSMKITGTVEYQDKPMDVSLSTGSLRQALEDYRSLEVEATLQIQETAIGINSTVDHLLPFETVTTDISVEGPNPARLGDYLGIPLPRLPPYRVHARLHREQQPDDQQTFNFTDLEGTVGDSDVGGTLRVTTGGERPMIFARLHSDTLDFDDLGGLVGAPPDPEETASPEQKEQAEDLERRNRLLPDDPVDFTKLRETDADVEFQAKQVQTENVSLDQFFLKMGLNDGHLQMTRLDYEVAQGTVAMQIFIKSTESPVQAKMVAQYNHIHLNELLQPSGVANDAFGDIHGQATLWMQGKSVAEMFASSDGGLYLLMTGGKIDSLLVELAGLDFAETAAVFVGTDTGVPIECAYADLQVRKGLGALEPLVIDTTDTKFKGSGKFDLRQETLQVTVKPYPKDFSLLSSRGPLHITGTLNNPEFNVDPSFPLPEFGTAEDSAHCSGLMDTIEKSLKTEKRR